MLWLWIRWHSIGLYIEVGIRLGWVLGHSLDDNRVD